MFTRRARVVTAGSIEGWTIAEYKGLVSAHAVAGTGMSGEWLGPAAKVIAAIGPSHDRRLPTKKTPRVVHDHGLPDVRLYRGRTEVGPVHHLRNGPLPRAR